MFVEMILPILLVVVTLGPVVYELVKLLREENPE